MPRACQRFAVGGAPQYRRLGTLEPVVVIGAGIGGLAAALRLAAFGHAVEIVERHISVGGKLRGLPTPAGPADAGPTVLTLRHVFDALFAAAGTRIEDHLEIVAEPVIARHYWPDGSRLDLLADPEATLAELEAFGGSRAADDFRRFRARAAALFAAFDGPVMRSGRIRPLAALPGLMAPPFTALRALRPWQSLAGALAADFADPRLRQLFGRYATYVGGVPGLAPALLALLPQAELAGVWRLPGGLHRLATTLAALAEARGARIRLGCHAAGIEVTGGRARAVRLEDGRDIAASAVLFNGDPQALALGLLGPQVQHAVPWRAVRPRSLSAHVLSFAAVPHGVPLAHHTVFFCAAAEDEFGPLARGQTPRDASLYVCAQDVDAPAGRLQRFEIIRNAPPLAPGAAGSGAGVGKEARADVPAGGDTEWQQTILAGLAARGLRFAPGPGTGTLTRPADFAALFPGTDGAIYGRSPHGLMASFLRPVAQSRIPGLFLAGGGVHPGPGLPMAATSGRHAAAAIMRDLASTLRSRPTAMPGGMSMASAATASAPSRSSPS
jgi:1-hydroxycarotenoid 3,4-desaturase